MNADASHARLAGFLYLGTIGFGVYAEVVARGALIVRGDSAATAQAIFASGSTFRLGMIADLAMLGCYIGVTILLHGIFRKRAPLASATAASFSLIGIAVLACDTLLPAIWGSRHPRSPIGCICCCASMAMATRSALSFSALIACSWSGSFGTDARCQERSAFSLLRRAHAISSTASPGSERRSGRRIFRNISPSRPCSASWRSRYGCWRSAFTSARRSMRVQTDAILPEQGR